MEFSGLAYCAENKKLNFTSFMSPGTFLHKTSNMGMHHINNIPFVELTGHKLQEPIVSSSFEINSFTKSFSIPVAGKIHNFTANTKHFVRSDNILTRKDLYGHQFPAFSFSQLVGGFVGSKSQIGSSCKESLLMCDIIFGKLAEFCGTHHPQNCSNFSQDVLKSFCKKERPPCVVIENSANIVSNSKLSPKPNSSQNITDSSPQLSSEISKQSYAEVARIFATVQQNKQSVSTPATMPRRRNPPNRRNFVKCEMSRTIANNWRNHCNPQMKEHRNHTRFFSGSQRRSDNKNIKSTKHFEKEQKTDKNVKETCTLQSQRVDSKKNFKRMTSDSVQIVPKISSYQECHMVASEISSGASNNVNQIGQTSPVRMRYLSECSTDSDDSFVVFDSEAVCDSVIMAVMKSATSKSDFSEDVCSYKSSDDEDDDTDCVDGDDTETVTELNELNERWEKENSAYPTCTKNPVKVHFASNNSLEAVHPMVAWNFAYRAARHGPWEQMARDRERFKTRIQQMEPELAGILSPEHRCRVWTERMASESAGT